MEREKMKQLLLWIDEACRETGETDAAALVKANKALKQGEVLADIETLAEEDLIVAIEIDLCCGADYVVKGLTEKGAAFLRA